MKDTFALFGPSTELIMLLSKADEKYQFLAVILSLGGYMGSHLIKIWVKDSDGDGKVDMLQP